MADEEEIEIKEPANEASKGKNPILSILLLLNTIMIAGVAYFQYTLHEKINSEPNVKDVIAAEMKKLDGEEEGEAEAGLIKKDDGLLFPLDGFTANLAQGDGPRRFVRMKAVLKFTKDSSEDEFKARKPQIRDVIISTLNSKRPEDLLKLEGKSYLKEELKAAINAFLIDGRVIDVFYVGFQIN